MLSFLPLRQLPSRAQVDLCILSLLSSVASSQLRHGNRAFGKELLYTAPTDVMLLRVWGSTLTGNSISFVALATTFSAKRAYLRATCRSASRSPFCSQAVVRHAFVEVLKAKHDTLLCKLACCTCLCWIATPSSWAPYTLLRKEALKGTLKKTRLFVCFPGVGCGACKLHYLCVVHI